MIEDILDLLRENNTRLDQLKSQIDAIIKNNDSLIAELQSSISADKKEVLSAVPENKQCQPQDNKEDIVLKSIRQLWRETTDSSLFVKKPSWKPGFCLVIRSIAGDTAQGTLYECKENGTVSPHKEIKAKILDDAVFVPLQKREEWIKTTILSKEKNTASVTCQTIKKSKPSEKRNESKHKTTGSQIQIGSIVTLVECNSDEKFELKVLQSYHEIFYKTMGYKKKNYAEATLVSDADGVNSVSDASTLGKQLLGKCAGDSIIIEVNGETRQYRIMSVQ